MKHPFIVVGIVGMPGSGVGGAEDEGWPAGLEVPEVEPLLWKFRQAWTKDNQQVSLVFINSAYIASYDTLNEPLYYIIVCEAYSTIGELPRKLYLELNSILG